MTATNGLSDPPSGTMICAPSRSRMPEALLTQIAAGEPAAVDAFLRRHTNMVWGLARRFCRSAEDAEDATQDIFVEVWKSAELLEDAGTIAAPPTRDRAELHDEVQRAQSALAQLRPEQREVLDLALGQGRTHQEISAAIGIPLGTVKSHARRGLIRLREMLGVEPTTDGKGSGGGA